MSIEVLNQEREMPLADRFGALYERLDAFSVLVQSMETKEVWNAVADQAYWLDFHGQVLRCDLSGHMRPGYLLCNEAEKFFLFCSAILQAALRSNIPADVAGRLSHYAYCAESRAESIREMYREHEQTDNEFGLRISTRMPEHYQSSLRARFRGLIED